ncbi:MetQ/NlpA family ABC transporter substrate-binding protein [Ammoniphilus sp. YIM 78166]|uniref:MetQ/NlpA family ABC transporter substrate-binding protein n=1 Tax=Ammoniphilus sp. YIM 78166 TaxID=1644106 RepID=UPI00106F8050|nr:MetQ/NlpA family ABC transporter substrate-binding protein [Ammoniphilus sp. YIM 78166]
MKKFASLISTSILALALLAGCGGQPNQGDTSAGAEQDSKKEAVVLKVGATAVPHAEILEQVKPLLLEKGVQLEVQEFNDYILPNKALEDKQLDANFFQHVPYLESFNQDHKTHLVAKTPVHFEPLGLYAGKSNSLDSIQEGALIAVPNDPTNEARALHLLQDQGLIKLPENADLKITPNDIVENPHNLVFKELEAGFIARSLGDVDFAVINGNYAIEAGLKTADALALEDQESLAAKTFANVVVVREGDENRDVILLLEEAITSPQIKEFIESKYSGAVVPMFGK